MPAGKYQLQPGSPGIADHFHTESIFVRVTAAVHAGPESTQPAQHHPRALQATARVAD